MIPTTKKPITVAALRHSGTHLIIPIVRYMTEKTVYSPKGESSLTCEPSKVVIVFIRDPRNWIVSALRFKHGRNILETSPPGSVDTALAGFIRKEKHGVGFVEHGTAWAKRWRGWPHSLEVRFEDLVERDRGVAEVGRISGFLFDHWRNLASAEEVYDRVFGKSGTFTGKHSRWQDYFGPEAHDAWHEKGGRKLVRAMGYVP